MGDARRWHWAEGPGSAPAAPGPHESYLLRVRQSLSPQARILFWASMCVMALVLSPSMYSTQSPTPTPAWAAFPPGVSCGTDCVRERRAGRAEGRSRPAEGRGLAGPGSLTQGPAWHRTPRRPDPGGGRWGPPDHPLFHPVLARSSLFPPAAAEGSAAGGPAAPRSHPRGPGLGTQRVRARRAAHISLRTASISSPSPGDRQGDGGALQPPPLRSRSPVAPGRRRRYLIPAEEWEPPWAGRHRPPPTPLPQPSPRRGSRQHGHGAGDAPRPRLRGMAGRQPRARKQSLPSPPVRDAQPKASGARAPHAAPRH